MLTQESGVERGRVVEVDLSAVLVREVAQVVVVGVVVEVRDPVGPDTRHDFPRDRGLAGPGAAGDPEGHDRHGLGVSFASGFI